MKAVIFDNQLRFVQDCPVPDPSEHEALIRVSLAGICNTDLEIIKGYRGYRGILGHEFVGVVEKAGGRNRDLTGSRVAGEINIGCGNCEYCGRGMKNHCLNRKVIGISGKDGAMAEYLAVPVENLHEIPDEIPDEEAVFTEPLAAVFGIPGLIEIKHDATVVVLGDGKLGLLAALALSLSHPDITLMGKHEQKLKIAVDRNIRTLLAGQLKSEQRYDVVIEATGSPNGFETAINLAKPRGTVVLKSTVTEEKALNLSPLVVNEITVIGSRCGHFEPALAALSGRLIDVRPLITGIYPFDQAGEAFRRAGLGESLKVMIDFRKG